MTLPGRVLLLGSDTHQHAAKSTFDWSVQPCWQVFSFWFCNQSTAHQLELIRSIGNDKFGMDIGDTVKVILGRKLTRNNLSQNPIVSEDDVRLNNCVCTTFWSWQRSFLISTNTWSNQICLIGDLLDYFLLTACINQWERPSLSVSSNPHPAYFGQIIVNRSLFSLAPSPPASFQSNQVVQAQVCSQFFNVLMWVNRFAQALIVVNFKLQESPELITHEKWLECVIRPLLS